MNVKKESIMKNAIPTMLAGFHSVGLSKHPIAVAIEKVAAAGYKAIELNAETLPWAEAHVTPQTPATERAAIVARAKAGGLSISAVSAHVPMVEADPASRHAAVAFVNGCIELARDVDAPIVHILSGQVPSNTSETEAWNWFAETVAATTERAEASGIVLGIEAIAGHLFRSIDDYRRLACDLSGVPFKINFDPSHLVVQGEDPVRVVEEHGARIVHVHMKDGDGHFPNFTFPPLGAGKVDFDSLLSRLAQIGYKGTLSVEYEAQVYGYHESEEQILNHGRSFLSSRGLS